MIKILPFERWNEIEAELARFDCVLPEPSYATVLFKENSCGNISTFAILESLIKIGQIHSIEKGSLTAPREILRYALKNIPSGSSVIAIDDNERFDGLCRKFGMYELKGKVYRRDF